MSSQVNKNLGSKPAAILLIEPKHWCGEVFEDQTVERAIYHSLAGKLIHLATKIHLQAVFQVPRYLKANLGRRYL